MKYLMRYSYAGFKANVKTPSVQRLLEGFAMDLYTYFSF